MMLLRGAQVSLVASTSRPRPSPAAAPLPPSTARPACRGRRRLASTTTTTRAAAAAAAVEDSAAAAAAPAEQKRRPRRSSSRGGSSGGGDKQQPPPPPPPPPAEARVSKDSDPGRVAAYLVRCFLEDPGGAVRVSCSNRVAAAKALKAVARASRRLAAELPDRALTFQPQRRRRTGGGQGEGGGGGRGGAAAGVGGGLLVVPQNDAVLHLSLRPRVQLQQPDGDKQPLRLRPVRLDSAGAGDDDAGDDAGDGGDAAVAAAAVVDAARALETRVKTHAVWAGAARGRPANALTVRTNAHLREVSMMLLRGLAGARRELALREAPSDVFCTIGFEMLPQMPPSAASSGAAPSASAATSKAEGEQPAAAENDDDSGDDEDEEEPERRQQDDEEGAASAAAAAAAGGAEEAREVQVFTVTVQYCPSWKSGARGGSGDERAGRSSSERAGGSSERAGGSTGSSNSSSSSSTGGCAGGTSSGGSSGGGGVVEIDADELRALREQLAVVPLLTQQLEALTEQHEKLLGLISASSASASPAAAAANGQDDK